MDVMLGTGKYNQIERDIDQMTGFSNHLNRDEIEEEHSLRGNSSQVNEIRNMLEIRNDPNFATDLELLTGERKLRGSLKKSAF